jgi:hypothetical protein
LDWVLPYVIEGAWVVFISMPPSSWRLLEEFPLALLKSGFCSKRNTISTKDMFPRGFRKDASHGSPTDVIADADL